MSNEKGKIKEQLHKKSLSEIEIMIIGQKRKIGLEKNLTTLSHLSTELSAMQEIRDQKQRESGRLIHKSPKSTGKPELKSYDDYVKSKK